MEDADANISSLELMEQLVNSVQHGGREEVTSLFRYTRGLEPAGSARDALESIRRWKLASAPAAVCRVRP